jgi:predicted porin
LYLGSSFADATIYGTFDQAYRSDKITIGTNASNTKKGIDSVLNGGMAIGFKGSEDMGNGMKAYFQQEIGLNTDQNGGPTDAQGFENRNSFVGLSGGFGDVKIGKMYNFAFYNIISNDPFGFTGTGGYIHNSGAGGINRTSNMIAYTVPTIAAGVGIQIGKSMGETVSVNGSAKTGDATSYGLTYAAGALYAGVTGETVTGALATSSKTKHSSTTITYDLGMVKVGYGAAKTTIGTDYIKAGAFSVTVPLGAVTLAYTNGDGKAKSGTAAEVKTKYSQVGGMYALSKRTNAYLHTGKQSATTFSANVYAIGVKHDF